MIRGIVFRQTWVNGKLVKEEVIRKDDEQEKVLKTEYPNQQMTIEEAQKSEERRNRRDKWNYYLKRYAKDRLNNDNPISADEVLDCDKYIYQLFSKDLEEVWGSQIKT